MIIFDFDGVLIDPIQELALVSYNLVSASRLFSIEELPKDYLKLYLRNHHLVVTPKNILDLSLWSVATLESGGNTDSILSREELSSAHLSQKHSFTAKDFFEVRKWLMEEHSSKWLELNKPFPEIWRATQKLDPNKYFILTNKNRSAVEKICEYYGLKILSSRLFTGETGRTKHQNILELDKLETSDTNYIFVDDAIENLEILYPVLPGRIHPVLATWGYNNAEDRLTAQKHGFELASEADFVAKYLSE